LKIVKWGLGALGLTLVAGIIAVSAGAFGGVASAQEPGDPKARHEAYLEKLAENLGVSVDELKAAQEAARNEMIDEAVAAGRITAEQAERLKNREPGDFRRNAPGRVKHALLNVFESAASILGLSNEELRTELQSGKSLAGIADEKGVGNLEAQLVAKLTADIQAKVADGSITQAQADRLLENLPDMVERVVNHEGGKVGPGPRGRGFGPGRFGPGGPNQN
jgi:hypothetical protein